MPEAIVDAVRNDPYSRGPSDISVTQLIAPPRKVELERRHSHEIVEDASDRIWALLGQAAHSVLQRAKQDALTEERLFASVAGWTVSGAFDTLALMEIAPGLWDLSDYKITSVWAVKDGAKIEWEQQLNCLAQLLRRHTFDVGRLRIIAILRDWSKLEAKRSPDYPQRQVVVLDVPLWTPEKAEAYLAERVRIHRAAREAGELPDCTPEERWARPTVWAVTKAGNKRATSLHHSEIEAQIEAEKLRMTAKRGSDYVVTKRPGESARCASYCAAAPFCDQWKRIQAEQADGAEPQQIAAE